MITAIMIILFFFLGLVIGYSTLRWGLRQDNYFIVYDGSKEIGDGRYQVIQELDLDEFGIFGSNEDE